MGNCEFHNCFDNCITELTTKQEIKGCSWDRAFSRFYYMFSTSSNFEDVFCTKKPEKKQQPNKGRWYKHLDMLNWVAEELRDYLLHSVLLVQQV